MIWYTLYLHDDHPLIRSFIIHLLHEHETYADVCWRMLIIRSSGASSYTSYTSHHMLYSCFTHSLLMLYWTPVTSLVGTTLCPQPHSRPALLMLYSFFTDALLNACDLCSGDDSVSTTSTTSSEIHVYICFTRALLVLYSFLTHDLSSGDDSVSTTSLTSSEVSSFSDVDYSSQVRQHTSAYVSIRSVCWRMLT